MMDISLIRQAVKEILQRKDLDIEIKDDDILHPNFLSSLEIVELLLIIDNHNNEYRMTKLDLSNLSIKSISNYEEERLL